MRKSQRVEFPGRRGKLAGILETPQGEIHGWMLFSHCFTCNKDLKAIVRIARGLADCGWGVLRYDFSGLGGSDGNFAESNFTTNCEDLASASSFLAAQYHSPRFLIGHSFGGAASLAMADQIPSVTGVIALAAPSDTHHLADLLVRMNPAIASIGLGSVVIGGQKIQIQKQMVEDFRNHELRKTVGNLRKSVLIFHSPEDETVAFYHAIRNAGYDQASVTGAGQSINPRTLVALPGSNHLLTNSDRDIPMIVSIANAWCTRLI
jgi:putative redox protein